MKKFSAPLLLSFLLILGTSYYAISQCNAFTKRKCIPTLKPFQHNGLLNSVSLSPGESAALEMTFYVDTDYRLAVCNDDRLGEVSFKVLRKDSSIVFDSKKFGNPKSWDFTVNSTQQYFIEVFVQNSKNKTSLDEMGCVSVLAGYKKN
jgi:hypothetical protein